MKANAARMVLVVDLRRIQYLPIYGTQKYLPLPFPRWFGLASRDWFLESRSATSVSSVADSSFSEHLLVG